MKILVINAGSSSLKYQLIDMDDEKWQAKGICDRIGMDGAFIRHQTADGRSKKLLPQLKTMLMRLNLLQKHCSTKKSA